MVWSESAYPAPPTRNRRAGRQAGRQAQGPPADPSREAPSARPIRDPAQVKPAYPRPRPAQQYQPALQATCPTPRSLPYTTAPPAGARPGPTGPGCCLLGFSQVSPAYPAPPRAQTGAGSARPLLRHSPPPQRIPVFAGTCTGEIEAKDGLPSADRNNKATLLLTGPFRTAKSSAKDLTPLVLKLQYAKYHNHSSVAVEESPAKTLSRSLFLSICTCGWYHRVLAWILT